MDVGRNHTEKRLGRRDHIRNLKDKSCKCPVLIEDQQYHTHHTVVTPEQVCIKSFGKMRRVGIEIKISKSASAKVKLYFILCLCLCSNDTITVVLISLMVEE